MGVLTEIRARDGSVYWISSDFPGEWNDVKWMAVEARYSTALTPAQLYDMIEEAKPYTGDGFLRPVEAHECTTCGHEGVFVAVKPDMVRDMPVWQFSQVLAYAKAS